MCHVCFEFRVKHICICSTSTLYEVHTRYHIYHTELPGTTLGVLCFSRVRGPKSKTYNAMARSLSKNPDESKILITRTRTRSRSAPETYTRIQASLTMQVSTMPLLLLLCLLPPSLLAHERRYTTRFGSVYVPTCPNPIAFATGVR
jgi:hypothetical protein